MRVFWLLLALLVAGAAAIWWLERPPVVSTPVEVLAADEPALPTLQPSASLPAVAHAKTVAPPPSNAPSPVVSHIDPVRQIDDRTVRLADRFDVIGRGTPVDPYRVSWPLLGSAIDTIDAEHGKLEVPGWLSPLDGSWIEISGYLAPPLAVAETSELLVTMNKWDGCCIGLPPTAFDSLETRLDAPVAFQGKHIVRFGTLRGQFRVEPVSVGGFLLSLYRLEHATITTQGS